MNINSRSYSENNLIITVNEARKLLGKSYQNYSDEEVARMIKQLDSIADSFITAVPKY